MLVMIEKNHESRQILFELVYRCVRIVREILQKFLLA